MPGAPKAVEVIARGLAIRDARVLLCRNVKRGHAFLPGGHVDPGETAPEALAREFEEEAGLQIRVGPFLIANEHLFTQQGKARHEWTSVFHVEHAQGPWPDVVQSREAHITFEWCEIAALGEAQLVPAPLLAWLLAGGPGSDLERLADAWMSYRDPNPEV